jgi:hypothetical protein
VVVPVATAAVTAARTGTTAAAQGTARAGGTAARAGVRGGARAGGRATGAALRSGGRTGARAGGTAAGKTGGSASRPASRRPWPGTQRPAGAGRPGQTGPGAGQAPGQGGGPGQRRRRLRSRDRHDRRGPRPGGAGSPQAPADEDGAAGTNGAGGADGADGPGGRPPAADGGAQAGRAARRLRNGVGGALHPLQFARRLALRKITGGRIDRTGRRYRHTRHPLRRAILTVIVVSLLFGMVSSSPFLLFGAGGADGTGGGSGIVASPQAVTQVSRRTGIPTDAVEAYLSAASAFDVDWAILAGIGQLECNHGRSQLTGCIRGTANFCGARGPMQFLGNTWRRGTDDVPSGDCPGSSLFTGDPIGPPIPKGREGQGYATDGDGDGVADPWEWRDATHAAARYLLENGLRDDLERAIRRYNNKTSYVNGVVENANRYRSQTEGIDLTARPAGGATAAGNATGNIAEVRCSSGNRIRVDSSIAANVQAMLEAAAADGVQLCGGGWRSREEQIRLRTTNGCPDVWSAPSSSCRVPTAIPGTSMHERGLAIDFTCAGELIRSHGNRCFQWLDANAARYGLRNLPAEAWHWSTNGR